MPRSTVQFAWRRDSSTEHYTTGVSLHSHTSHSKETLDFIPRLASHVPLLREAIAIQEQRFRAAHGRELDYMDLWWTPPVEPREALHIERRQIREELGLHPLVSISDHDDIEAPMLLRVLSESRDTPVSVEWTVPYGPTFFHLGVHNLPPRRARERMAALAEFTANPDPAKLEGLLDWLVEDPETLIIFNHPYWDEKAIGSDVHAGLAWQFIVRYRRYLHALELNGLRPWSENRQIVTLAESLEIPFISGGDRHTTEPNAILNLSDATTFSEFVEEVREYGVSNVLVMPHYREPLTLRLAGSVADVLRDQDRESGGSRWSDRVYVRSANGDVNALSRHWPDGAEPLIVRLFIALARKIESRAMKSALRQFSAPVQELRL